MGPRITKLHSEAITISRLRFIILDPKDMTWVSNIVLMSLAWVSKSAKYRLGHRLGHEPFKIRVQHTISGPTGHFRVQIYIVHCNFRLRQFPNSKLPISGPALHTSGCKSTKFADLGPELHTYAWIYKISVEVLVFSTQIYKVPIQNRYFRAHVVLLDRKVLISDPELGNSGARNLIIICRETTCDHLQSSTGTCTVHHYQNMQLRGF